MHDRWDHNQSKRSIEDLKERYYNICAILAKVCQMNVLSASFFLAYLILPHLLQC